MRQVKAARSKGRQVNGVFSVPLMAAMMVVATRRALLGAFVATRLQATLGWLATAVMAAAVTAAFFVQTTL